MAKPWERQKGESSDQFHGFSVFRDLGPTRDLIRVCKDLGRHRGTIQTWSAKWEWYRRAEAWDDEQDRIRRSIYRELVKEMGERHARIALLMLEKVVAKLKTMDHNDLSPSDLAKWVQIAVTIERQAFGEPGEIVHQSGNAPQLQVIVNDVKKIQSDPEILREAVDRWESYILADSHRALESGEPGAHAESE